MCCLGSRRRTLAVFQGAAASATRARPPKYAEIPGAPVASPRLGWPSRGRNFEGRYGSQVAPMSEYPRCRGYYLRGASHAMAPTGRDVDDHDFVVASRSQVVRGCPRARGVDSTLHHFPPSGPGRRVATGRGYRGTR